jgi:hypothetical protein
MAKLAQLGSITITVVESLTLGALVILELLSGYRAGVMQHLYFKKIHYLGTLYNHDNIIFHLIGLLFCAFFVIIRMRHTQITNMVRYLLPFGATCFLLIICSISPFAKQLNIYAYLLICLECCIVLETCRIFLR